jgi:hypothetical protein
MAGPVGERASDTTEPEGPSQRRCDEDDCSAPADLWAFIGSQEGAPEKAVCHACADEIAASEEAYLFTRLTAAEKFNRGD